MKLRERTEWEGREAHNENPGCEPLGSSFVVFQIIFVPQSAGCCFQRLSCKCLLNGSALSRKIPPFPIPYQGAFKNYWLYSVRSTWPIPFFWDKDQRFLYSYQMRNYPSLDGTGAAKYCRILQDRNNLLQTKLLQGLQSKHPRSSQREERISPTGNQKRCALKEKKN